MDEFYDISELKTNHIKNSKSKEKQIKKIIVI